MDIPAGCWHVKQVACVMSSSPTPPPASLNCMGVADVQTAPMPAPRVRPAREQPTSAPLTMGEGTRKGAAEQPPFPPAQPELVNRVPEGAALPEPRVEAAHRCSQPELMDSVRGVLRSWSRRSVRGRDLCNWSRWTAWGRDLSWLSWGLAHQWNPPRFHQRSVCDGVLCTSCLSSHLWASAHVSFGVIRLQTMTFIWLFNWRLHQ